MIGSNVELLYMFGTPKQCSAPQMLFLRKNSSSELNSSLSVICPVSKLSTIATCCDFAWVADTSGGLPPVSILAELPFTSAALKDSPAYSPPPPPPQAASARPNAGISAKDHSIVLLTSCSPFPARGSWLCARSLSMLEIDVTPQAPFSLLSLEGAGSNCPFDTQPAVTIPSKTVAFQVAISAVTVPPVSRSSSPRVVAKTQCGWPAAA